MNRIDIAMTMTLFITAVTKRIMSAVDVSYECSKQILVHHWWKCIANDGNSVGKCFVAENLLSPVVLLCNLYLM